MLPETGITVTHKINTNIWGHNNIQAAFPKEIALNGLELNDRSIIVSIFWTDNNGYNRHMTSDGFVVGDRIIVKSRKSQVQQHFDEKPLFFGLYKRSGECLHKQPLNKKIKTIDYKF